MGRCGEPRHPIVVASEGLWGLWSCLGHLGAGGCRGTETPLAAALGPSTHPTLLGRRRSPGGFVEEAAERVGFLSVASRYHRLPMRMEDDYVLTDRVLGSGYNGVVRLAHSRDQTKQQRFAIKTLRHASLVGRKRALLDSEVSVFLGMDHPHVARLFDVYETDEHLCLVMECLEGGELFERVVQRTRYSEEDAAEAVKQMLLALNYLHSHGIVHRDLKLENFLYDFEGDDHLKLIDFGFSKVFDPNIHMHASCGTLAYLAPEVLGRDYTHQCDLWSLGVIAFILLSGYMPFCGSARCQKEKILAGKYTFKQERWQTVSSSGIDFVRSLLQVDPERRLTAEGALEHAWLRGVRGRSETEVCPGVVEALRTFSHASKFRRCCMELMAWSLSNEERAGVREDFEAMDRDHRGTITLQRLRQVLTGRFHLPDSETLAVFEALDSHHDDTIHYSDFLAAMLSTRIDLHDDLIRSAFRRFDAQHTGYITAEDLRNVLGGSFEGEGVEALLSEADVLRHSRVSYPEFAAYLRGRSSSAAAGGGAVDAIMGSGGELRRTAAGQEEVLLASGPCSGGRDGGGVGVTSAPPSSRRGWRVARALLTRCGGP